MEQGWITLHRKLREHWLWKESKPFSKLDAWIDILLDCNHEDKKVNIGNELFVCKRGQSFKSQLTWAKRWGWSRGAVQRFFKLLESDSMVELETNNKTSILTVSNYNTYQDVRASNEHQMSIKRAPDEHQMSTNNNDNNVNNDNKDTLHPSDGNEAGKNIFIEDSVELRMSKYLYSLITKRNPKHKEPNFQSWAKHIDLLLRVDERDLKEAVKVLEFSQTDSFWQNNILSTKKFRDKYDQLKLKMESNKHVKYGNCSNGSYKKLAKGETDPYELADYLRQIYKAEEGE